MAFCYTMEFGREWQHDIVLASSNFVFTIHVHRTKCWTIDRWSTNRTRVQRVGGLTVHGSKSPVSQLSLQQGFQQWRRRHRRNAEVHSRLRRGRKSTHVLTTPWNRWIVISPKNQRTRADETFSAKNRSKALDRRFKERGVHWGKCVTSHHSLEWMPHRRRRCFWTWNTTRWKLIRVGFLENQGKSVLRETQSIGEVRYLIPQIIDDMCF
jgi:hypothetical protein